MPETPRVAPTSSDSHRLTFIRLLDNRWSRNPIQSGEMDGARIQRLLADGDSF
jgi:hypothetical protein